MESPEQLKTLAVVFLAIGAAFLAVAIATGMSAFYAMPPAFIALGVVFLARSRQKP